MKQNNRYKSTMQKQKDKPQTWGKYFQNALWDKGPVSRIYRTTTIQ